MLCSEHPGDGPCLSQGYAEPGHPIFNRIRLSVCKTQRLIESTNEFSVCFSKQRSKTTSNMFFSVSI